MGPNTATFTFENVPLPTAIPSPGAGGASTLPITTSIAAGSTSSSMRSTGLSSSASPSATDIGSTESTAANKHRSSLSTGAQAGIGGGVAAGVLLTLACDAIYWWTRRRSRKAHEKFEKPIELNYLAPGSSTQVKTESTGASNAQNSEPGPSSLEMAESNRSEPAPSMLSVQNSINQSIHRTLLPGLSGLPVTTRAPINLQECRDEFNIAIVCAVLEESQSILAAMDEIQDHWNQMSVDHNTYTVGLMSGRKVVLVYLARSGQTVAGQAAARLYASFPRTELALVVGICGAVPRPANAAEIYLGDLIISDSIVTGDFGRNTPSVFERYDTVQNPSDRVGGYLYKIRIPYWQHHIRAGMSTSIQQIASKRALYQAQSNTTDLSDELFDASYVHKHRQPGTCDQCNQSPDSACERIRKITCDELGCDKSRLLHRPLRDDELRNAARPTPHVHIGRIGSGNALIRSGEHRDAIATKENLIAFEMEGAAVHRILPTLIVKAVCDYADSHKNKSWQPFAADIAGVTFHVALTRHRKER